MNRDNQASNPQQQKEQNSSGNTVQPFGNDKPAETDIQQAQNKSEKEQEFKEAQTERD